MYRDLELGSKDCWKLEQSRMESVKVHYTETQKVQKQSEYLYVLTWNRWAPWRRVAGLSGATGLSVLQKWMLDSSGLGVSNRVGV